MRARRATVLALIALSAAAVPATATAAPRKATDGIAALKFTLDGRQLALKISGRPHSKKESAKRLLPGKRVNVTCGTKNAAGQPNTKLLARGSRVWARTATSQTFRLSRNIAAKADWCMVQGGATIVSYVDLNLGRNPRDGTSA
jgi:hypothetical protein